jgi:hypothetical protein
MNEEEMPAMTNTGKCIPGRRSHESEGKGCLRWRHRRESTLIGMWRTRDTGIKELQVTKGCIDHGEALVYYKSNEKDFNQH